MSDLFIVARSLAHETFSAARPGLEAFFAASGPGARDALVLLPAGLALALPAGMTPRRYDGTLGIEHSPALFADLARAGHATIAILGSEPLHDFEEIVLACFLSGDRKLYLDTSGNAHDIARTWQPAVRPDFSPREVRATRLAPERERDYIWHFHKWLEAELAASDYGRPAPVAQRRPETLIYGAPRLAVDLAQQTPDLQAEVSIASFRASFSTLMLSDGSMVTSADYYRAMANFIASVPEIDSILDVGCGSGFLSCYLAASGRHRRIIGVDATPSRVEAARLHARLAGAAGIDFRQMSMARLDLPDASVDAVVTSFALEQSGAALGQVIAELRRVARKYLILFEPTSEYFTSLAGLWHIRKSGWANQYFKVLGEAAVSYAVRPTLLGHYFNTGSVFVIDLASDRNPVLRLPHLFRADPQDWPGGLLVRGAGPEEAGRQKSD